MHMIDFLVPTNNPRFLFVLEVPMHNFLQTCTRLAITTSLSPQFVYFAFIVICFCACPSQCGNGPNLVLLPSVRILRHVQTPSQVAQLVKRQVAGGESAEKAFEVLQLRTEGNMAYETGKIAQAIAIYGKALDLGFPHGRHLLHGNRSSARFASGDIEGALEDAESAIEVAPEWAKGYLRLADVMEKVGKDEEALEALHAALDRDDSLVSSTGFRQRLKDVRARVNTEA